MSQLVCMPSELVFDEQGQEQQVLLKSKDSVSAMDVKIILSASSQSNNEYDINPREFRLAPLSERLVTVRLLAKPSQFGWKQSPGRDTLEILLSTENTHKIQTQMLPVLVLPAGNGFQQGEHDEEDEYRDYSEEGLEYGNSGNNTLFEETNSGLYEQGYTLGTSSLGNSKGSSSSSSQRNQGQQQQQQQYLQDLERSRQQQNRLSRNQQNNNEQNSKTNNNNNNIGRFSNNYISQNNNNNNATKNSINTSLVNNNNNYQSHSLNQSATSQPSQIATYKRIIEEKDTLIAELEAEVLVLKNKFQRVQDQQQQAQEIEQINSRLSTILAESNPNVAMAIELALQQQRIQNDNKNQRVLEVFEEKDAELFKKETLIQELRKVMTELERENMKIKSRIQIAESEELERKTSLDSSQREVLKELEVMQREINGYKQELLHRQMQSEQAERNMENERQRIRETEESYLREEQEKNQLREINAELEQEITELRRKEEYWQQYFDGNSNERRQLSERVEEYKQLEEDLAKLSEEHTRLLDKKEREIRELSQQLRQLQEAKEFQKDQAEGREGQVNSQNKLQGMNQERIARLENEISQQTQESRLVNQQLSQQIKQNKILADQVAAKSQDIERLEDQLQVKQGENDRKVKELSEQYAQALLSLQGIQKENRELTGRASRLSTEEEQKHSQECKQLKVKISELESREKDLSRQRTDLQDECTQLSKLLSDLREGKYQGEGEQARLMRECERLEQLLQNERNKYRSLEDTIRSYEEKIQQERQRAESEEQKAIEIRRKLQQSDIEKENIQLNAQHMAAIADELDLKAKDIEDRYREENISLQQKQIDLQARIFALENEVNQQAQTIQDQQYLKEKIEITSKVNAKFEADLKTLKMRCHEDVGAIKQQMEEMQQIKGKMERKLEETEEDNRVLHQEAAEKEIVIKRLNDESDELDHRNQLLMAENSKINELNRKYGIEIERIHAQLVTSKDQTEWAERKKAEIEEHLALKVGQLQEQLKREQDDKIVLKRELNLEIEKMIRNHSDDITHLKALNEELQERLNIETEERQRDAGLASARENSLGQQVKLLQMDLEKSKKRRKSVAGQQQQQQSEGDKKIRPSSRGSQHEQLDTKENNNNNSDRDDQTSRVNLEMELHKMDVQLLKERQAQDQLRSALRRNEAAKDALNNENYALKTAVREVIREKEDLVREMNVLQIQTKHTDPADAKVFEELQELRETMRRILIEKERMEAHLNLQDNELSQQQQQLSQESENIRQSTARGDVLRFMKNIELKYRALESEANMEVNRLKEELAQKKSEYGFEVSKTKELKKDLERKEQECVSIMEERANAKREAFKHKEMQDQLEKKIGTQEIQKDYEIKQLNEQIGGLQGELQKQEQVVSVLREEMANQNRTFKEIRGQSEGVLQMIKGKFVSDLSELQAKFQQFIQGQQQQKQGTSSNTSGANSSSTAAINYGSNLREDKKYLTRLFESYAENVNIVSHKDAMIKKLQEKEKKAQEKEKNSQKEIERLQDLAKKQAEELQNLLKKGVSMTSISRRTVQQQQQFQKLLNPAGNNNNNSVLDTSRNNNNNNRPSSVNHSQADISINYQAAADDNGNNTRNNNNNQGTVKITDIAALEAQLFTTKTILEQAQEEIAFQKDYIKDLKDDIDKISKREEDLIEENRVLLVKVNEQIKSGKVEKEKLTTEIENVKNQYFTPEVVNEQKQQIEARDKIIKELKEDVNRKKDLVQSVKQLKEEQSYDLKTLQVEIERQQMEIEKLKLKANKANAAAAGPSREQKALVEGLRASEKKLLSENEELTEKLRVSRSEVLRGQQAIKELKAKLEICQQNQDQAAELTEQLEKAKEQLKKLKGEVERKETSLKNHKNKLETANNQLEELQNTTKTLVNRTEVINEQKKTDGLKQSIKQAEAQTAMLVFLLKRIFRDCFVSLNKLKASNLQQLQQSNNRNTGNIQQTGGISNTNKFSESVNILGLSPQEINQFIDPYAMSGSNINNPNASVNNQKNAASEFYSDMMDRFEHELENIDENVNVNSLYNMLSAVIEERIEIIAKQGSQRR